MRLAHLSLLAVVTVFAGVLAAQVEITRVIHEPKSDQVGPHIAANFPFGEGKGGFDNELPDTSEEFYAMGATTTHDLALITNNSAADLLIDCSATPGQQIVLVSSRPAKDVATQPERNNPGWMAPPTFNGVDPVSVAVPIGSTVAVFMVTTQWMARLDTSPRDYILTISMFDLNTMTPIQMEATMTIPKVGGEDGDSCSASDHRAPAALLLALAGMAAILPRRFKLERAK